MSGNPVRLRDFRRLAVLGPAGWKDLLTAVVHLARARLRLQSELAIALARSTTHVPEVKGSKLSTAERCIAERVGFALSRAGPRLPWRADCLVQAFAGRHWLAKRGVATRLVIGARRDREGFAAHAWLMAGDSVVTGGDIASYTALTVAERSSALAFD